MIIGVTGTFGSGKTTVANMFKKYGFKIINVDKLYHNIYNKNLKNKIKKEFDTLDKEKIRKIVFGDYKKLKKLNKITHPIIIKSIKKEIYKTLNFKKEIPINKKTLKYNNINSLNKNKKNKNNVKNNIKNNVNIVIDAPLLIEAKAMNLVDKIVVVKCNKNQQIKRVLKKKKYTKNDIEQIIKSQMPSKDKLKYADFVVDNSRTMKETSMKVKKILNSLSF